MGGKPYARRKVVTPSFNAYQWRPLCGAGSAFGAILPPESRALNEERSAAAIFEALRQIVRFWRTLLAQAGTRKMLVASALTLLSGLTEGLALLFLAPLIQSLDPAAGAKEGATAWLPQLLQRFGIRLNLIGVLALFLGLVVARSFLIRQSDLRAHQSSAELPARHARWALLGHRSCELVVSAPKAPRRPSLSAHRRDRSP